MVRAISVLEHWARAEAFGPDFNGSPCMYLPNRPGRYGYVSIWVMADGDSRLKMAHRAIYELLIGPIQTGLTLDHQCHNADDSCNDGSSCVHRACVNPWHMEPCTSKENTLRGKGPAATQARQTHCKRGHSLSGDNLYFGRKRRCKTCTDSWQATSRARNSEYLLAKARERYAIKSGGIVRRWTRKLSKVSEIQERRTPEGT